MWAVETEPLSIVGPTRARTHWRQKSLFNEDDMGLFNNVNLRQRTMTLMSSATPPPASRQCFPANLNQPQAIRAPARVTYLPDMSHRLIDTPHFYLRRTY